MNTIKIAKPFAKSFNTLLNGEVVSYSPRSLKVAIGQDAVVVSKEVMEEIINTSNAYGEKFSLVVSAWNAVEK
ncbi:hypothetical protein [Acinetobacter soli]|uniref:hypothetical protein n=1 Tax=Acinetobacter soli TaxID=487316 RepID=UPI0006E14EAA|nr:hypothetical protein [Acinetobacter soli]KQD02433.1 hypothetical protein APD01_01240 [Acinetobacter soli]KQD03943.1 hypothetical protein APD01_10605 [Acinetobacter soli]